MRHLHGYFQGGISHFWQDHTVKAYQEYMKMHFTPGDFLRNGLMTRWFGGMFKWLRDKTSTSCGYWQEMVWMKIRKGHNSEKVLQNDFCNPMSLRKSKSNFNQNWIFFSSYGAEMEVLWVSKGSKPMNYFSSQPAEIKVIKRHGLH